MEFRVLGPVGLVADGDYVRLGGTKARTVLAALTLRAGRVVSVSRLIDAVWGEEPPPTAQALVQTQIAVLRKVLAETSAGAGWCGAGGSGACSAGSADADTGSRGGGGGGGRGGVGRDGGGSGSVGGSRRIAPSIITRSPGYLVQVGGADVDLLMFEAHASQGRNASAADDLERASACFADALAVWSGPALGGVAAPLAMTDAFALEQERTRVRKEWIEAELGLGRHHALVPTLYGLVAEAPVDEALRGRLMLALYRSGRADEALAVCRDGRRIRADELGMDPGPAMKALEHAILAEDPTLEGPGARDSTHLRPPAPRTAGSAAPSASPPTPGAVSPIQPDPGPPPSQRAPQESASGTGPTQDADSAADSPDRPNADSLAQPNPGPPPSQRAPQGSETGTGATQDADSAADSPDQPTAASPVQPIALADAIPAPRTSSPFPRPAEALQADRRRWSRRRVVVAALAVLTALTVAAPAAVTVRELLMSAPAAFSIAVERVHAPSGDCLPRVSDNDDLRNGVYLQTWHQVAMCRNDGLAPLYLVPSTGVDSPVVGRLRTGGVDDLSWFLCWITGVPDHGAGSVYYYTTADDWAPGMEYRHGWGFVPAAYLAIGADHARSGLPECPPVPGW